MKEQKTQLHGLLVVDKPEGPTSTACLNTLKREHRQKKIGHAGTLDPMATGVLLVMLGQATKIAPYLSNEYKVYSGQLELGRETDSYDRQGKCVAQSPWQHLTEKKVSKEILAGFALQVGIFRMTEEFNSKILKHIRIMEKWNIKGKRKKLKFH